MSTGAVCVQRKSARKQLVVASGPAGQISVRCPGAVVVDHRQPMIFRYPLPERLVAQAMALEEFANGGAQCHVRLRDGAVYSGLLMSNGVAIIAMRGYSALPFELAEIETLFQTDEDRSSAVRDGWEFFDVWSA